MFDDRIEVLVAVKQRQITFDRAQVDDRVDCVVHRLVKRFQETMPDPGSVQPSNRRRRITPAQGIPFPPADP
jgi:hypothetical protein